MKILPINLFGKQERVNLNNIVTTEAGMKIYDVRNVLENYAKKNHVNISFNFAKDETNANKLNIIVTDNNFLNCNILKKAINPDVNYVERTKVNDSLTSDDTFLKRVFRGVSELTENMQHSRKKEKAEIADAFVMVNSVRNFNNLINQ